MPTPAIINNRACEAARALPGVATVWTATDLPEIKRSMPAGYGGSYKGRAFQVPVLADERVRYVGEGVLPSCSPRAPMPRPTGAWPSRSSTIPCPSPRIPKEP